jgi:methylated-DNA-[protein]-cysteine S-methyltransferase
MAVTETSVSIETGFGVVSLAWQRNKLCTVLLGPLQTNPRGRRGEVVGRPSTAGGQDLVDSLVGYFEGRRTRFQADLELSSFTEFQRLVWGATEEIPYGETRSYSWVATRIGRPRAVRAVGAALGRNPVPVVIPCHRVVGANGSLTGFAFGLAWKEALLGLEGSHEEGAALSS